MDGFSGITGTIVTLLLDAAATLLPSADKETANVVQDHEWLGPVESRVSLIDCIETPWHDPRFPHSRQDCQMRLEFVHSRTRARTHQIRDYRPFPPMLDPSMSIAITQRCIETHTDKSLFHSIPIVFGCYGGQHCSTRRQGHAKANIIPNFVSIQGSIQWRPIYKGMHG